MKRSVGRRACLLGAATSLASLRRPAMAKDKKDEEQSIDKVLDRAKRSAVRAPVSIQGSLARYPLAHLR